MKALAQAHLELLQLLVLLAGQLLPQRIKGKLLFALLLVLQNGT